MLWDEIPYEKRFAFVDLDGVLADFIGGAAEVHQRLDLLRDGENPGTWPRAQWDSPAAFAMSDEDFWGPLKGAQFWKTLKKTPWADLLLEEIEACFPSPNIFILTSPFASHGSAAGKLEWVARHYGWLKQRVIVTVAKHAIARPGAVLIDDSDQNCEVFRSNGGGAILVPQPWNSAWKTFDADNGDPTKAVKAVLDQLFPTPFDRIASKFDPAAR